MPALGDGDVEEDVAGVGLSPLGDGDNGDGEGGSTVFLVMFGDEVECPPPATAFNGTGL